MNETNPNPTPTPHSIPFGPHALRPLGGRVIARSCGKYEPDAGPIVKAETARKKGTRYRVIATCPTNTMIRPGDIILVDEHSGTDIEIDGLTHRIVNAHDVIAKYQEPNRSACVLP